MTVEQLKKIIKRESLKEANSSKVKTNLNDGERDKLRR